MRGIFFSRSQRKERSRPSLALLVFFLTFSIIFSPVAGYAQAVNLLNLPVPGAMVQPSPAFAPVLLKGMTVHPDNPLQFDFIIDSGNTNFDQEKIEVESQRLVKYFLASMTIPKDDLWVNLSPYEADRIIPDELGKTELGRDMLAQDYILKQLTASLMYPEKELGQEFWAKVYRQAKERYGSTEIPVNTFNKVWILPETATVYEHGTTVYIVEAKLRVMLDSDYVAQSHQVTKSQGHQKAVTGDVVTGDPVTSQIIREVILPAIEREVNEGQNFAPLRQIYHSLILAKWYKETVKNSLLSKIYIGQNKIAGVNIEDATIKDQIYARYMEAYKKGVFNYIKEDYDRLSNETIPRKYFSGGEELTSIPLTRDASSPVEESNNPQYSLRVAVMPQTMQVGSSASSPIKESNLMDLKEATVTILVGTPVGAFLGYFVSTLLFVPLAVPMLALNDAFGFNITYDHLLTVGTGIGAAVPSIMVGVDVIQRIRLKYQDIKIRREENRKFESDLAGIIGEKLEYYDIYEILRNRVPHGKNYNRHKVLSLLSAAIELRKQGYDFEIEYQEQVSHIEEIERSVTHHPYDTYHSEDDWTEAWTETKLVVDVPEKIEIVRGEKLMREEEYEIIEIESDRYPEGKDVVEGPYNYGGNTQPDYYKIRVKKDENSSSPVIQGIGGQGTALTSDEVGGIDMNEINVDRQGEGVDIHFDPIEFQEMIDAGIDGFTPVIINLTPLPSVLPFLGLGPKAREEEFEISRRGSNSVD